jgi:hypothetical protein
MVIMCLAIVGCTLIGAPQPAQSPPAQEVDLAAYLQHENENLRKRAAIILAADVLAVRQPHSGDPEISPPLKMLFNMRASELPTLFDYLRNHWKKPLPICARTLVGHASFSLRAASPVLQNPKEDKGHRFVSFRIVHFP